MKFKTILSMVIFFNLGNLSANADNCRVVRAQNATFQQDTTAFLNNPNAVMACCEPGLHLDQLTPTSTTHNDPSRCNLTKGDTWVSSGKCALTDRTAVFDSNRGAVSGELWTCKKTNSASAAGESVTCQAIDPTDKNWIAQDGQMFQQFDSKTNPRTPASAVFATKVFSLGSSGNNNCAQTKICENMYLCTHPASDSDDLGLPKKSDPTVTVYEHVACPQVKGACPDPTTCYKNGLKMESAMKVGGLPTGTDTRPGVYDGTKENDGKLGQPDGINAIPGGP